MADSSSPDSSSPDYSPLEIQEILQLAIVRQVDDGDRLSRAQLLEVAAELEIEPEAIALAELQWKSRKRDASVREEFDRSRQLKFQQHGWKFAIVNGFLVAVNVMGGPLSWSLWIAVPWGLGLSLDAYQAYGLAGDAYEKRFLNWQRKRQLKQSWNSLVDRVLPIGKP
jgi:2TM domain